MSNVAATVHISMAELSDIGLMYPEYSGYDYLTEAHTLGLDKVTRVSIICAS